MRSHRSSHPDVHSVSLLRGDGLSHVEAVLGEAERCHAHAEPGRRPEGSPAAAPHSGALIHERSIRQLP